MNSAIELLKKTRFTISLICFYFLILYVFKFNGLYGQDSFEYHRYAGQLRSFFLNHQPPGDYFWPVGYPFYGALFSFVFQNVALSLQLVSFIGFLFCGYFANKIIEKLYPQNNLSKHYIFLFLSLSPFFLRSSMVVMTDMVCAAFITASVYFSISYSKESNLKNLLLFCFCFSNAIMFRYAAAVILFPVIIWMGLMFIKQKNKAQIIFCLLILLAVFLPHILIRKENTFSFLNHGGLATWSFGNYFLRQFVTDNGNLFYFLPNIFFYLFEIFHPGYFVFGIVFVFFSLKQLKFSVYEKVIFFCCLLYLIFLMGFHYQNSRFFIPILPLAVILGFKGFLHITEKIKMNIKIVGVWVLSIQLCLFFLSSKGLFERNKFEQKVFYYLQNKTSQKTLYSFDIDVSLKGYGLNKTVYNLWEKQYNDFEKKSLVLFNPKGFEKQWKGQNPMLNWEKIKRQKKIKLITTFDKGWELYEIL